MHHVIQTDIAKQSSSFFQWNQQPRVARDQPSISFAAFPIFYVLFFLYTYIWMYNISCNQNCFIYKSPRKQIKQLLFLCFGVEVAQPSLANSPLGLTWLGYLTIKYPQQCTLACWNKILKIIQCSYKTKNKCYFNTTTRLAYSCQKLNVSNILRFSERVGNSIILNFDIIQ